MLLEENPATIVIDALDECDPVQRQDLLLGLRRLTREAASVVKIFVSSRDDTDIVTRMATSSEVYIKAEDNTKDIERFAEWQVEKAIAEFRILNGEVSAGLEKEIIDTLKSKAGGM